MNIALCRASVLAERGGCESYVADLAGRLAADGHEVHLYARHWDGLPASVTIHAVPAPSGPRFLHRLHFAWACRRALMSGPHDVTVGFDGTWGQDVLFPLEGLYRAAVEDRNRTDSPGWGVYARLRRRLDPGHWAALLLERRRYAGPRRPPILVPAGRLRDDLQEHYAVSTQDLHEVRLAVDAGRFPEHDRLRRRQETREGWGLGPGDVVALLAADDPSHHGVESVLRAVRRLHDEPSLRPRALALRLVVTTPAPLRRCERLAGRLRVAPQVRFVEPVRAWREAYFASDFLAYPVAHDVGALRVLEALTCGLPVLASRDACESHDPPHEGLVLDDLTAPDVLASRLAQFLEPARRHAATVAARRASAGWTFEHHYQQVLAALRAAAARKRAA